MIPLLRNISSRACIDAPLPTSLVHSTDLPTSPLAHDDGRIEQGTRIFAHENHLRLMDCVSDLIFLAVATDKHGLESWQKRRA